MTIPHVSDELLQRHFDGELEPSEQTEAHKHLADCTDCTARLQSLERLSGLIRMASEEAASNADFRDMWSRIDSATAAVTPTAADAPARVLPANQKARAKWFRPATMSALGGLAVAAAVLLMIYRDEGPAETLPDDSGTTLAMRDTPRSEIVQVDFGTNAGTVFEIAMADGTSTPVIWINDEE